MFFLNCEKNKINMPTRVENQCLTGLAILYVIIEKFKSTGMKNDVIIHKMTEDVIFINNFHRTNTYQVIYNLCQMIK